MDSDQDKKMEKGKTTMGCRTETEDNKRKEKEQAKGAEREKKQGVVEQDG